MPLGKSKPGRQVTAVMWFANESTYNRFREVCADRENFSDSYVDWQAFTAKKLEELSRDGVTVRKVEVDPETFLLWCKTNSRRPDGRARAAFAALKAQS